MVNFAYLSPTHLPKLDSPAGILVPTTAVRVSKPRKLSRPLSLYGEPRVINMLRGQHIPGPGPGVSLKWTNFCFLTTGSRPSGGPGVLSEHHLWSTRGAARVYLAEPARRSSTSHTTSNSALTTRGSNCVPEFLSISSMAVFLEIP